PRQFDFPAASGARLDALVRLFLRVRLDVLDRVLDGPDLLRVLVRDVNLEGLLEREDELHQAQRICSEVVDERRLPLDVLLVDVELLLDDPLYFGRDVATFCHGVPPGKKATPS